MQATNFEFRYRFWIIAWIYCLGFSAYRYDQQQTARWLAAALTGGMHGRAAYLGWRAVLAAAALLALAAAALRTWGAAYLRSQVVHDRRLRSERLVSDGPYRFTRNPLYLGGLMMGAACGLLASRIGFLVLVAGLFVFYARLTAREEIGLGREQREPFRAYRAAVPRLWPRRRPGWPASATRARWGQAFLGEALVWIMAGAAAALAIWPRLAILG